ncbi:13S condensin subunit [Nosema bombycis CQ1]|uniref:13S condensin subunit n=1 Tax=Nosema bombycis (strain CQ1 / CVCC 102059) TaxID=578461 RepID=R0KNI3_NOSB1|nr:13S condensin subunit [Nosema bombycis CQ1]|eukprot:EOB12236.1 13S condensin subunit [Nosema bombycis CQ1]
MLNTIISKMKKLNLESQHEQYIELIDTCGDSEDKHLIFRIISSAPGPLNIKLSLIFSLVSKLKKKYDHKLVQDSLEFFNKNQSSFTLEDYEWIVKIIFMIIENIRDKKKNDEIKLKIMETLQKCSQEIDIKPYLFNFMLNDNSWEIVYALLVFMPNLCDSFVREALLQTNLNILKNVSHILSTLSSHHKSLFFNYKHFDSFLDSDIHF